MTTTATRPEVTRQDARGPQKTSPPWTRRRITLWAICTTFVVVSLYALVDIGVNPLTLWFERDDIGNLLERMWPPRIEDPASVFSAALDTFFMAFVGTVMAFVIAVPVAFLAARNTTSNPVVRSIARGFIVFTRAVPDLIFAAIFVRVYSIGVLPGVIALGIHSVGMLGKLFADSIEQIDRGPRDGVAATGAGRGQEVAAGIIPQIIPSFIAITLYRLDINFRSATLLGIVGAGGIGLQIRAHQGSLDYQQLLGVTIVIIVMIVIVELISTNVRSIILGHDQTKVGLLTKLRGGPDAVAFRVGGDAAEPAAGTMSSIQPGERSVTPPWTRERVTMYVFGAVSLVMVVLSFTFTDMSLWEFLAGLPEIPATMWRLIPDNMDWWQSMWAELLLETVLMGFAATFLALIFAIPTGLLAARNIAPARWIYVTARYFVLAVRALPELVIAVLFVAALGLGPKPGVLALSIGLYGFATKLFADAFEEVSERPREGIRAAGAGQLQEVSSGVMPQAMPSIVGNSLYLLDVSVRASTVLGIVGAGGIGFALIQGTRLLQWDLVGGLLICVFIIVYGIELLAGWVRKQLL